MKQSSLSPRHAGGAGVIAHAVVAALALLLIAVNLAFDERLWPEHTGWWISAGAVLSLLAVLASACIGVIVPTRRLTAATRRIARLEELARRDPLTGLDNRRELLARLSGAIGAAPSAGGLVGVLFLDIDNFKHINDSMGHLFGDRLLISLARRLLEVSRPFGRVGRLGGDEFTVIIDGAERVEEIHAAGLAVVQAFQEPLTVDGHEIRAGVSVGASIYPYHAQDAVSLLQAADAALFRAKALGRSKLSLYSTELAALGAARLTTEQGLRDAVERGEFELVFQPEVNAASLTVTVVETLVRWRMPDGSLITPDRFLSVAEESGLIVEISNWVLQAAVQAAALWHHGAWPEVRVAINVSSRQLLDRRFVDRLQTLLEEFQLPARCIELELIESVLQAGPVAIDALKYLRAKGVAIALDDFGTGYSALSSLEKLPLTRVKLDRSLIAKIDVSPRAAAVARGIIAMCQELALEITAEGVERTGQLAQLLGHRQMSLQGYLFCGPVLCEELMPLMDKVAARAQGLLAGSRLLPSVGSVDFASETTHRASEAG